MFVDLLFVVISIMHYLLVIVSVYLLVSVNHMTRVRWSRYNEHGTFIKGLKFQSREVTV